MNLKLGLSVYNKPWLIESSAAVTLLELWLQISAGAATWEPEKARAEHSGLLQITTADSRVSVAPNNTFDLEEFITSGGFTGASVAVIPVIGPMMKSDYCGSIGTNTLKQLTNLASKTDSVNAIVYLMDSPGGTVDGTQAFAEAIKASNKRTIALADGYIASACYWVASACDEIYASNDTDIIGSVGTMITIRDYSEALKQQGVVVYEYNADASADKNLDFNEAKKGNGKALIQNTLNPVNDIFLTSVRTFRGDKINDAALTGQTYTAKKAISVGLIDGVKSFDEVITSATSKSVAYATGKPSINNKSKNTKMTIEQLRSEHPDLYKEVVGLGVRQESERVKTLLVHHKADPERIVKAIKEGEELSPSMREELTLKANSKPALTELEENKPAAVVTAEAKTEAEEKKKAIEASLNKQLGITL